MNNKRRDEMAQSSQGKGKETMSVELSGKTPSKIKKVGASNQEFKFPPNQYFFKVSRWLNIPFAPKGK